jgi:hypothetical protein
VRASAMPPRGGALNGNAGGKASGAARAGIGGDPLGKI